MVAVTYLVAGLLRRMAREGLVVRSLAWPPAIVLLTLVGTMGVLATFNAPAPVAIPVDADSALEHAIRAAGYEVTRTEAPADEVASGRLRVATDGATIWSSLGSRESLEVEGALRTLAGARWLPESPPRLPSAAQVGQSGRSICRVLTLLYVLYAVVFTLGGVLRDRANGTLEAELALPMPRWASGVARWFAATWVAGLFCALSVVLVSATVGIDNLGATIRHGIAGCNAAAGIGLVTAASARSKRGFSASFAWAVTLTTVVGTAGNAADLPWLPIAGTFGGTDGHVALLVSLVFSAACIGRYAVRVVRP